MMVYTDINRKESIMKKLIAIIAVIALLFTGYISYDQINRSKAQEGLQEMISAEPQAQLPKEKVDYAVMYKTHEPEEVVATIDGKEITWRDYFYFLSNHIGEIESYFNQTAMYYGMNIGWKDVYDQTTGETFEEIPAEIALEDMAQFYATVGLAEKLGVKADEKYDAVIDESLEQQAPGYLGEGKTKEDVLALYEANYLNRDLYYSITRGTCAYSDAMQQHYGAECENVTDEQALGYLEDGGYLYANHILFLTKDMMTNEDLEETAQQEKLEKAQALTEELRAIEDTEERVAKFLELKQELDEDTGKSQFPNGYVFTAGEMVAEFEDAAKALEDYEISEPVKTNYGYHVLIRLPLDPDAVMDIDDHGSPVTARGKFATEDANAMLQEYFENMPFEFAEGFTAPKATDFFTTVE